MVEGPALSIKKDYTVSPRVLSHELASRHLLLLLSLRPLRCHRGRSPPALLPSVPRLYQLGQKTGSGPDPPESPDSDPTLKKKPKPDPTLEK